MNRVVVAGIIVSVIAIGILYAISNVEYEDFDPVSIDAGTEVSDHTVVEKNIDSNNPNYIIDENGHKRYGIVAVDSPDLTD